ncbi:putative autophagy-related protein 11 [Clytia hemisphaerica]|uniref:putative autophagy-related protein 11 n=1 Tax=Clytia hemisphaerica TaxID=252671 RepID=UPI0034D4CCDE
MSITTRNQQNEQEKEFMKENFNKLNEKLDKLTLDELNIQKDTTEIKNVIIKNLVESNKKLQKTVENLKNKVNKLEQREKEQTINVEKQNQYGRRNNVEVSGICNDVRNEELEDKVIKILEKIDVKVTKNDIEACHRLPPTRNNKTKRTIVRFVNRKNSEKCLKNKKKLGNVNFNELELPDSFKFQNESLVVTAKENSNAKIKVSHKDHLLKYYNNFFNPDNNIETTE